jgi:ribosomal protein S18 acetylase RimI-like enzyme
MDYLTAPLSKLHKKESFSCGLPSLDRYLKEQAGQDMKRKLAVSFVLSANNNIVKGYYTLSNGAIPKAVVPEEIQRRLGYREIPVTLLGRLAVDQQYHRQGLGELLLLDALKRSQEAAIKTSGSFAVITDPIDHQAEKFYTKYGFQRLEGSYRMFLSMKTIEGMF